MLFHRSQPFVPVSMRPSLNVKRLYAVHMVAHAVATVSSHGGSIYLTDSYWILNMFSSQNPSCFPCGRSQDREEGYQIATAAAEEVNDWLCRSTMFSRSVQLCFPSNAYHLMLHKISDYEAIGLRNNTDTAIMGLSSSNDYDLMHV